MPECGTAMNRDAYNAVAASWDAARRAFYGREQYYLDTLIDGLTAPARILDLGCGTGRPMAEYLLNRGHAVIGVDQASALLNIARARLPAATWVESRIEDYESQCSFDGIVCWDALFHIERTRHPAIFRRMAGMLPAGGRLMLTSGGSAHPAFTDTMFGERFFYDALPPDEVLRLLEALGFVPLIAEFMNPPTSGRDKGRYAIIARKSG